jgi:hypothetical protein
MRFAAFSVLGVLCALIVISGCGTDSTMPTQAGGADRSAMQGAASAASVVDGVDIVAGGVGLLSGSGSFSVNVPVASAAEIVEAGFYWSGRSFSSSGDPDIVINSTTYPATLVNSFLISQRYAFFYKLDAMGIVQPGMNTFNVSGFDMGPDGLADGIGLYVVYEDDTSDYVEILTMDLGEYWFWADPNFPNGGVHNFAFDPVDVSRDGQLLLFVGDCEPGRSDAVWFESSTGSSAPSSLIGGPYPMVSNVFNAAQGEFWDVWSKSDVMIPADAGHMAFQIESPEPGNGDSGMASFAAFAVPGGPPPPPPGEGCFWTIGFWKHQFNVALGDKRGHQHLSNQELESLLAAVYGVTDLEYDRDGDNEISFREADYFLDLHGNPSKCRQAMQQFLATLLNYAKNGLDGSIMVDTDYNSVPDMRLDDAVAMIEQNIDSDDCETAKDMADSINNMPDCDP